MIEYDRRAQGFRRHQQTLVIHEEVCKQAENVIADLESVLAHPFSLISSPRCCCWTFASTPSSALVVLSSAVECECECEGEVCSCGSFHVSRKQQPSRLLTLLRACLGRATASMEICRAWEQAGVGTEDAPRKCADLYL